MADLIYTRAKRNIALGDIHFDTDDIRVALVMTNTTTDTEEDTALMNAFTTLDEFDGAGYSRQALASERVVEDTVNNRAEFDNTGTNTTFSAVSAGTRNIQGCVVYLHVTNDTDSIPIAYIDSGFGAGIAANGGDITIQWNAEGIIQFG